MSRPNREDLIAALGPLADEEPGKEYRSVELLPVYNAWAEQNGKAALTVKALGEVLAREVTLDRRSGHGHLSIWTLTRAGLECRNWHVSRAVRS